MQHVAPANIAEGLHGTPSTFGYLLTNCGYPLTAGGTTDRAIEHGAELMEEKIRECVKDEFVAVIIAEATMRIDDPSRPMALLGTVRGQPILLDLIFDAHTAPESCR